MHRLPGLLVVLPNAVGVQLQLIIGIIVIVSLLERTGTLPEAGASKNIICMTNEKLALSLYAQNCGGFLSKLRRDWMFNRQGDVWICSADRG